MRVIQLAAMLMLACGPARAADLIVSANDGKFVRVEGAGTFPRPAPPDSLAVIDAARTPPAIVSLVTGIEHTIQGPPQAVAITPDGRLAIVGAPSRWDDATGKEVLDTFLQVVDLSASPPHVSARVEIGAHANGIAVNPQGTLLLAAALDGTVKVLTIEGQGLSLAGEMRLSGRRLGSVTFTHDGAAALVSLREDGGLAVLAIYGKTVTDTKERVSSGVAPYTIDVAGDGHWAVVSNVGLNGLQGFPGASSAGDADSIALVDVSRRPFRTVQYLTVPSIPEGVAISPDGHWIAVQVMNGSNLTPANPGRRARGVVILYRIEEGLVSLVNAVPGGEAAQGIVFGADNHTVLVQFDVEKAIAVYDVREGTLVDTGQRLALEAGPVSIRSAPR